MGFITEFKQFAMKGNMVDLAIGVVMGAAFGKIIDSLVGDVITPLLLSPALKAAGVEDLASWHPGGIYWGKFLSAVLSFIVIAFVLFLIIKALNKAASNTFNTTPPPSPTESLLAEIRDSLKK